MSHRAQLCGIGIELMLSDREPSPPISKPPKIPELIAAFKSANRR